MSAVEVTAAGLRAWRQEIYADHPVTRDYYADRAADAAAGACACCTKYGEKYLTVSGACDDLETIAWLLGEDFA